MRYTRWGCCCNVVYNVLSFPWEEKIKYEFFVGYYLSFFYQPGPDALLGSAWPNMYPEFQVPVSYAGMISMIIAFGTILSSLQSDRLTRRFGTGKVTAASVGITALALWGFSVSHSFLQLCLWAIPYGLGAVLTGGAVWNKGYRVISLLQIVLTAVLIISLPKWKEENPAGEETRGGKPLTFREIISIPGAKAIMLCFFCYCAVEQTTMLWASSYLNLAKGIDAKTAASFAGIFWSRTFAGHDRSPDGKRLCRHMSDATLLWSACKSHIDPDTSSIFAAFSCNYGSNV